jgi:hypothetical protein
MIKQSLCTWWLEYRKLQVMFKVSPASLQTIIDTRLTLTPSVICNSNYVNMVNDWNSLNIFACFLYCNHQVYRDLSITLYFNIQFIPHSKHSASQSQKQISFFPLARHNYIPFTTVNFATSRSPELPDGSLQYQKAYHSKLIAISFVFIGYFSKTGYLKHFNVKNWHCCLTQRLYV